MWSTTLYETVTVQRVERGVSEPGAEADVSR
jgi:hypothetical protein